MKFSTFRNFCDDLLNPRTPPGSERQAVASFPAITGWGGRGEDTVARIFLAAAVIAVAAVLARALYVLRFRYSEMAFALYYRWWQEFRSGIDPWHAKPPCLYPPPFVMLFSPLSAFSAPVAYWIWQCIQVAAFFAGLILLLREAGRLTIWCFSLIVALVALLLPYFFTSTLYESEPTAILMLMLIASWRLSRHQRSGWAGLMLAAATTLKVYPVVAGGYFLFRRRLRVVLYGAAWTIAIVLVTGPQRWFNSATHGAGSYFRSLEWASDGRAISIPLNTYAALGRFTGGASFATLIAISGLLGIILLASAALITWFAADLAEVDGIAFGIWMPVMLLLCPLTWNHEITLILPAYVCAAIYLMRCSGPLPKAAMVLLLLALAGHAAAYYSTPLRNLHTDFAAVVIGYAGLCLVARDGIRRTASP